MATPAPAPTLVERTDIHKSCRSLENVLNVLNEYCEAVGVIVALQKKLAKALRETAGLKATGEIAANALNGSATVFEALHEVDVKYTKFADKEYDNISAEVKKWFKKLVKEEKAHDQKLEKANARIKQAAQSYEKKSNKKNANPSEAAEEHARYINLISTLGPEISQEKYNHALHVTERHTSTTASVASSFARIADAEWLKVCEGVRLLAPNVGTLTQWRVLCEGGWTEAMPQGLPDVPEQSNSAADTRLSSPDIPDTMGSPSQDQEFPATPEQQRPAFSSRDPSPLPRHTPRPSPRPSPQASPNVSSHNLAQPGSPAIERSRDHPPPSAFDTLKPPFFDPTTGSIRTLSAFPAPPTHLPTPPARQHTQLSLSNSVHSLASNSATSSRHPFTESPLSASQELPPQHDGNPAPSTSPYKESPNVNYSAQPKPPVPSSPNRPFRDHIEEGYPQPELRQPQAVRASPSSRPVDELSGNGAKSQVATSSNRSQQPQRSSQEYRRERDASEFGVQQGLPVKAQTYDALRTRGVERTESLTSNGSVVAAMRDRYSSNPGSTSPNSRELPRIPLSVNDLAARYQPPDSPTSSRTRAVSPPVSRQLSFPVDQDIQKLEDFHRERRTHRPGSSSISTSTPSTDADARRRRQESEYRAKERELHERERAIEARTRELEKDRANLKLMTVPEGSSGLIGSMATDDAARPPISPLRPRRVSLRKQLQRPLSQMELDDPHEPPVQQRSQISSNLSTSPGGKHAGRYGVDQQSPPSSSPGRSGYGGEGREEYHRNRRYSEERQSTASSAATPHAPYCGCQACSASKYGSSSSTSTRDQDPIRSAGANAIRPPNSPDKPKGGWMRRLSMPGGLSSAFSTDAKKSGTSYALGSGVSSPASPQQKKGILSFDGRKNSSATNLLRAPPDQETPRRSFETDRRRQ